MRRHEGFTLIEILLAVGLTGIIAVASLVPLVFTVQSLETVQKGWGKDVKVMEAAERIFRDTRNFAQCGPFPVFRIVHKEGLTIREDDRLLTGRPPVKNRAPGLVVYKIVFIISINKPALDGSCLDGGLQMDR